MQSASPPWPIIICLGGDAWQRARQWHCNPTVWALVCPSDSAPAQYRWPVLDLVLIVDWQQDRAAGHDEVLALARVLLQQGAELVAVCPGWVDFSEPAFEQDASLPVGERWVQVREQIVIYHRRNGQDDALST